MLNKKAMALFLEEPSELFHALLVDTEELGDKLILTFDFSRLSEQDRQAISEVLDYE